MINIIIISSSYYYYYYYYYYLPPGSCGPLRSVRSLHAGMLAKS